MRPGRLCFAKQHRMLLGADGLASGLALRPWGAGYCSSLAFLSNTERIVFLKID